tara:strand:- start:453 stop:950 length:498 start_codon:yes stop_codon:yes gene_type:complete
MMTKQNEEQVEQVIETEETLSETDQLKAELAEAKDAKLRALADFKNFQRRSVENEMRAENGGIAKIVRAIIPAIEQMNLAVGHAQDDAVTQGFKMAKDELVKGLADCGVTTISPKIGDKLDPLLHEGMLRQESDEYESDYIVQVLQQGYQLGDIVICPAKVALSA